MNCQNHPDTPATAYCRNCGKPVCDACRRDAYGTVFCEEHAPAPAAPPPGYGAAAQAPPTPGTMPPPPYVYSDVSPGLALFLGMIPGVGAIYNGQYAKGLVHAVVFGILCSLVDSRAANGLEPVFGILIGVWWFYMVFEAYHTARKRRMGEPVDEYSSLLDLRGKNQAPVAAVTLIVLGILMLMRTLDLLDFEYVARFWPVLLIAAGAWLLYGRISGHAGAREEVPHERQ